ncbi:MAG: hypothetical protein LAP13_04255 [Acidobacteriia bacterium]|nr:hypothetical protein [Terriglobia bacterium]
MNRKYLTCFVVLGIWALPQALPAQELVKEALAGFPPESIRIEYSSPTKLRRISNYQSLRQRYQGPRLQKLETALSQLGIREGDVDELILGWEAGSKEMDLYGLASGHFDPQSIAQSAQSRGMPPTPIGNQQAFCLQGGLEGTCIVAVSNSLGAFGSLTALTSLLEARAGQRPGLGSNQKLAALVDQANKDAPIWGVAVGPAVGDWFKNSMPSQGDIKLDWAKVFQDVESLSYAVDAADKVTVAVNMNCVSTDAASSLRQILEGLKLAQQLAWQNQNPNRPNPFEGTQLDLKGSQILLKLTTDYSDLAVAGG